MWRNVFVCCTWLQHIWPRRDLQPLFSQSECRIIHKTKIRSTENMQMLGFTLEEKKNPQISVLKDSF